MRRFRRAQPPGETPWSKTAGTGVTPVEMEAGDGHDLRPCRDMGALGPGRGDPGREVQPRTRRAPRGVPLALATLAQGSTQAVERPAPMGGETEWRRARRK